ncbi:MAG: 1,4-dihydroxy-2-naphthoate octaprenyltransferase [Pseudobdellovibrionaceae bacterium]|jgi:1,4-dihydroxy-2-naphthoate octaprenyltransferase
MILTQVILAFRPKTLTASLVPCLAGTALVHFRGGVINWLLFFYALISAFCIQIATNLLNDAEDFKKGADTEKRIGPVRITQAGILSYNQVLFIGFAFLAFAIVFGIPLLKAGGLPILFIGLVSAFLAYGYTAGPFPLAYLGLGDFFVILFFGIIAVGGMAYLHQPLLHLDIFVLGLQIGMHSAVLIGINNLRDQETDVEANKKTLAVRWGLQKYRNFVLTMIWFPFVLNIYWFSSKNWWIGLSYITVPLAILITKNLITTLPGPRYNQFLGQAAGLHLLFGLCLSLGFILS